MTDRFGADKPRVRARPAWERRYPGLLLWLDIGALAVGLGAAWLLAATTPDNTVFGTGEWGTVLVSGVALEALWLLVLWVSGAYAMHFLGIGFEEYKRVIWSAIAAFAVVAIVGFVTDADVPPGFVAIALGVGLVVDLVERRAARKALHRLRATGQCSRQVLVIGAPREVRELVAHLRSAPYAGLQVVAVCLPKGAASAGTGSDAGDDTGDHSEAPPLDLPVVGDPADPVAALAAARELAPVDAVVIADSHTVAGEALRALAWQLEGTGVQLVVAPAVTQVAGPRIVIRPIAGLPLLQVEEPELTGGQRLVKGAFDRIVSAVLLVLLSPVLLVLAIVVRTGSRGPALYRQRRVGLLGREFTMYKFRTMVVGADEQVDDLAHLNESDGVLFKIRDDPRTTRSGRFLRKHSLDELPQLWNVLVGDMSIVGPRPPLPSEVQRYGTDAQRRLLVKPGMSGLWQVSGRAELSWDESVRLDLYYVENWSPLLDAQILWRTVGAVVRGRGAY
ncbi:MAG: sugar transferase [Acidimicrobiia bacterium]